MSQPFKLYRLQQIDSQLDRVRQRLAEIEAALSADETLRENERRAESAAAALDNQRKNLRKAEQAVSDHRIKIEQAESTLYGGKVRNPKELQDMQNEAAALKRFLSVLEDRQLEAMIAVEEAEALNQTAIAALQEYRARFDKEHHQLNEEKDRLQKDAINSETERAAMVGSIPPDDIRLYEQLRIQRRGIAVVKVKEKTCGACGTTLSATLLHAAHSPSQITRCETCGRILYIG